MSDPARPAPAPEPGGGVPAQPGRIGVLPIQALVAMVRAGEIQAEGGILPDQFQPASLDLRLGTTGYLVRASFLPGPEATVAERIAELDPHAFSLEDGAVLEKGSVYVIPLQESLDLRDGLVGIANPKSTTGRLDVLVRLITDRGTAFDRIERGYRGPLYLEVAPRTFGIVARAGDRLNQIRFRRGAGMANPSQLADLLGIDRRAVAEGNRIALTIDLQGAAEGALVGWKARKHTDRIDLAKIGIYDPLDFWEPILFRKRGSLILDPDAFYILVSREPVSVPPTTAAEMIPYDTSVGEFRVHYAGFFDPGFGWGGAVSRAVLEVRSHEVPFMLEHGQIVGWLAYYLMADRPDRLYGQDSRSSYQNQSLALAKQFRRE